MRIRICDRCQRTIEKEKPFIMCQKVQRNSKNKALLEYVRVGDLCLDCWGRK